MVVRGREKGLGGISKRENGNREGLGYCSSKKRESRRGI